MTDTAPTSTGGADTPGAAAALAAPSHPAVERVRAALRAGGSTAEPRQLDASARTAAQAAASLGVAVGQIASSIVFGLPAPRTEGWRAATGDDAEDRAAEDRAGDDGGASPLLVVTSGAHRVDEAVVAGELGVPRLLRANAGLVRAWSGFAIGGVAPVGWAPEADAPPPVVLVDRDLAAYEAVWAAAGHPHAVFPTTFDELVRLTGGRPATVVGQGSTAS